MKLSHSARTDVGKTRDHNEDNFGVGDAEPAEQLGELLVVCDGMGGHASGEVASAIGVETIVAGYYGEPGDDRPHALEQAFEQANANIYARGQGSMGTTGVAALLLHDALHVANVGDSRAYLVRDGAIRQVSRDHSFVSDQVAAGLITADQARFSPHRNVITRALGYQPDVTVDLFRLPLQVGDIIVLSSDGMHGLVTDAEIMQITTTHPPEQASQQLIDLANSRGGTDNITVIVAHIEALDWIGSEPAAPEDLHERVTVELPTTQAIMAQAAESAEPPVAPAAPAPSLPARRPAEPGLNWRGFVLALALLTVLIGIILFYAPSVLAPPSTPTVPAAPSAAATTSLPTGTPAPTATTVATPPASTPTAR